jgi:hypothetical protein
MSYRGSTPETLKRAYDSVFKDRGSADTPLSGAETVVVRHQVVKVGADEKGSSVEIPQVVPTPAPSCRVWLSYWNPFGLEQREPSRGLGAIHNFP